MDRRERTGAFGREFLELCPKIPIRTEVVPYPLTEANTALADLRGGRLSGAAVLVMGKRTAIDGPRKLADLAARC